MLSNNSVFKNNFNFHSDHPLGIVCDKGYEFLLKYFIDHGSDPNTKYYKYESYDDTDYHSSDYLVMKQLVESRKEVEIKTPLI